MQLRSYIEGRDIDVGDFAASIGVSRQSVWRYIHGERLPRRDVMARIAKVTKGRVTALDFYPETAKAA